MRTNIEIICFIYSIFIPHSLLIEIDPFFESFGIEAESMKVYDKKEYIETNIKYYKLKEEYYNK